MQIGAPADEVLTGWPARRSAKTIRTGWDLRRRKGVGASVFDDYAHHPTVQEISATLAAAPHGALNRATVAAVLLCFNPIYSRTTKGILAAEFGRALNVADEVLYSTSTEL